MIFEAGLVPAFFMPGSGAAASLEITWKMCDLVASAP
jgi:hypothetical protein